MMNEKEILNTLWGGEDDEKTYCKFSVGSFHGG